MLYLGFSQNRWWRISQKSEASKNMSTLAIALCVCVGGGFACGPRSDFEVVGRHDRRARLSAYAHPDFAVIVFFGPDGPRATISKKPVETCPREGRTVWSPRRRFPVARSDVASLKLC